VENRAAWLLRRAVERSASDGREVVEIDAAGLEKLKVSPDGDGSPDEGLSQLANGRRRSLVEALAMVRSDPTACDSGRECHDEWTALNYKCGLQGRDP
jgi:hypothetical protein